MYVFNHVQYKESLLGAAAHGDLGNTDDPRRIIVTEFRVVFEDELTVSYRKLRE